jgi:hypothetical protein
MPCGEHLGKRYFGQVRLVIEADPVNLLKMRLSRSYNLPDAVNAAGCPRSRCARMAKTYRNPADLDAAARPGWPRSSPSSIRVDGNGHPLELKRNLLRRHDV